VTAVMVQELVGMRAAELGPGADPKQAIDGARERTHEISSGSTSYVAIGQRDE
jgi:hypothetical protein